MNHKDELKSCDCCYSTVEKTFPHTYCHTSGEGKRTVEICQFCLVNWCADAHYLPRNFNMKDSDRYIMKCISITANILLRKFEERIAKLEEK